MSQEELKQLLALFHSHHERSLWTKVYVGHIAQEHTHTKCVQHANLAVHEMRKAFAQP